MKRFLPLLCACLATAAVLAVPSAGAKGSKSSSKVSAADEQYLQTSISGDRFEIIGGKWAQHHTKNAAVLRMANRLVSDHSKSLSDAIKLAHSLKIDVPNSPTPSEVWELKMVASLHGKAYNHWYSSLEVYDHLQDISESTDEVDNGTNSQIRDDARTELPMLRLHLKLAREALAANPKG
jgi:predicted outer membrane protein